MPFTRGPEYSRPFKNIINEAEDLIKNGVKEITLIAMYKGVIPFVIIQIIALGIVSYYPETVLWLPDKLLGFEGQ